LLRRADHPRRVRVHDPPTRVGEGTRHRPSEREPAHAHRHPPTEASMVANTELTRVLHEHDRFHFEPTKSIAEDIARVIGEHGKGCTAGPVGHCPTCTLLALHAIELRLLMEE